MSAHRLACDEAEEGAASQLGQVGPSGKLPVLVTILVTLVAAAFAFRLFGLLRSRSLRLLDACDTPSNLADDRMPLRELGIREHRTDVLGSFGTRSATKSTANTSRKAGNELANR